MIYRGQPVKIKLSAIVFAALSIDLAFARDIPIRSCDGPDDCKLERPIRETPKPRPVRTTPDSSSIKVVTLTGTNSNVVKVQMKDDISIVQCDGGDCSITPMGGGQTRVCDHGGNSRNCRVFQGEVMHYEQPWDEEFIETSQRYQDVLESSTNVVEAFGRLGSAVSSIWDDVVAWFTDDNDEG